jgi:hypothetical protein
VNLVLTNVARVRCSVLGYPRLKLVTADGQTIPTTMVQSTPSSVTRLTIAPGRRVSSALHWIGIPLSDENQNGLCEPTPTRAELTPPMEVQSLVVSWSFGPVCGHGQIDAGPLRAGVPSS